MPCTQQLLEEVLSPLRGQQSQQRLQLTDSPALWALDHGHHALHPLSRNWLEEVLPMLGQHAQPIHGTLPQAAVLSL